MKIYTAHTHPEKAPVLIREGFAWGAFFFGPLWLLRHAAWIAAALSFTILLLTVTAAPPWLRPLLSFGTLFLLGLLGNDLRRWSLSLGQFDLAHVVAAPSREAAWLRLLAERSDLLPRMA